jgi:plastocyanin
MKRSLMLLALLVPLACTDATATTAPPSVVITLSPAFSSSGTCVVASPDPASIRAGQSVAFRNATFVTHTVIADGLNTPWTTIAPGETSGSIAFSIASTRQYYVQSCGNASQNLHTLIITVN